LVYNPSTRNRFPLVVVTGDDGITFRDMRIVQGELPVQRYAGLHRSIGPQYVRGISHWADDGSRAGETVMWLAYSMNKEDIWVSRVPLPVKPDVADHDAPAWNLYSPKWAPVTIDGDEIRLEDRDPHDYACATRVFPRARGGAALSFELLAEQQRGTLKVEVVGKFGSADPVRVPIAPAVAGQWQSCRIEVPALHRVSFRTGTYRGIGGAHPVARESDRPTEPVAFRVRGVHVTGQ
jgi:hypothetical protein